MCGGGRAGRRGGAWDLHKGRFRQLSRWRRGEYGGGGGKGGGGGEEGGEAALWELAGEEGWGEVESSLGELFGHVEAPDHHQPSLEQRLPISINSKTNTTPATSPLAR